MRRHFKLYCKEYWKIKNYELAKADNFKGWECHHILELTINGDYAHDVNSLMRLDMYYNRPYFELIFLTEQEHNRLHRVGIKHSVETRNKISEALAGKSKSEEHKRKVSESKKGTRRVIINGKIKYIKKDPKELP